MRLCVTQNSTTPTIRYSCKNEDQEIHLLNQLMPEYLKILMRTSCALYTVLWAGI